MPTENSQNLTKNFKNVNSKTNGSSKHISSTSSKNSHTKTALQHTTSTPLQTSHSGSRNHSNNSSKAIFSSNISSLQTSQSISQLSSNSPLNLKNPSLKTPSLKNPSLKNKSLKNPSSKNPSFNSKLSSNAHSVTPVLTFTPIIENSNTAADLIGKCINLPGYENLLIDRKMAEGGFSTVYSVKKSSNPKITYALKRMFVNNIQDLKACRTEIELMHSLLTRPNSDFSSNHVIQYYSHSIHYYDSEVYEIRLLMENATGGTLLDMMNSRLRSGMRGFESDVIRKVLKDVVQAIAALHFHENGVIVHRDLKIENILMNGRGDFVICDLGSATTKIVDTEQLSAGDIMVYEEELNKVTTQLYKSPEMVDLYQGQVIGSGVDIWVSKTCKNNLKSRK